MTGIVADTEPGYMALRYGPNSNNIPGVSLALNPLNYSVPTGFSGQIQWVQVTGENTTVVRTPAGGGPSQTKRCSGQLDTTYPYDTNQNRTTDSPNNQLLVGYQEYNLNHNFTMWLMFRPDLPNAIFVPLERVTWSWSADVISSDGGNTWNFVSKIPAGTPASQSVNTFPVWAGNTRDCAVHN